MVGSGSDRALQAEPIFTGGRATQSRPDWKWTARVTVGATPGGTIDFVGGWILYQDCIPTSSAGRKTDNAESFNDSWPSSRM